MLVRGDEATLPAISNIAFRMPVVPYTTLRGHADRLGSCPCLSVPFSPPRVPARASCPGDAPGDGSVCPCLVSLPQSVSLCLPCTATTTILTPVSDDGNCPCLFVPIANTSNTTSFDATRTTNATLTTTTIRNAFRHVHMFAAQAKSASSSIALMTAADSLASAAQGMHHVPRTSMAVRCCRHDHCHPCLLQQGHTKDARDSWSRPPQPPSSCRLQECKHCIGHSRVVFAMLLFAQEAQAFAGFEIGKAVATVPEPPTMSGAEVTQAMARSMQEPAVACKGISGAPTHAAHANTRLAHVAVMAIPLTIVCIVLLMYPGNAAQSMRMPPIYDPNDHTQAFRPSEPGVKI